MTKITVELNEKYREKLDLLKQIIPNSKWEQTQNDAELVEALVDEFVAFVEAHAQSHEHNHEWACCGWHDHAHEHTHTEEKEEWHCGSGSCGCKH